MAQAFNFSIYNISALAILLCLGGCTGFGSAGIIEERSSYNDAINYTSAEQTLANIVRITNGENPTFINIGDVTSNKSYSANINGGSSSIGALLPIGSLSSMLSTNDQPIVKYVPTTGYELIRQLSTPISLNDIYRLNNSDAPLLPLLVSSTNRITPSFSDYFRAIAIINALDVVGAISIVQRGPEVISIRFTPEGIVRTAVNRNRVDQNISCFGKPTSSELAILLWRQLSHVFGKQNSREIILNGGNANAKATSVFTRTAQGALGLGLDEHDIVFQSSDDVDSTIAYNKLQGNCLQDFYFTGSEESISNLWKQYYEAIVNPISDVDAQFKFRSIASHRSLILVSTSASKPDDAFVSYRRKGTWYYIKDNDLISKRNFSLLSTISIIQAVPAAATTPTVNAITLKQ